MVFFFFFFFFVDEKTLMVWYVLGWVEYVHVSRSTPIAFRPIGSLSSRAAHNRGTRNVWHEIIYAPFHPPFTTHTYMYFKYIGLWMYSIVNYNYNIFHHCACVKPRNYCVWFNAAYNLPKLIIIIVLE